MYTYRERLECIIYIEEGASVVAVPCALTLVQVIEVEDFP